MLRAWHSVLVVAVLLAGCSKPAAQESKTPILSGPHHLVTVKNFGPNDAKVTLTARLPNGSIVRDSASVKANATAQLGQRTAENSTIEVTLEYSWDEGGQASAGVLDLSYDSRGCPGETDLAAQLYTTAGASASSSTPAACKA